MLSSNWTRYAFVATSIVIACHSDPSSPSPPLELSRALDRVVPPKSRAATPAIYDAGKYSWSGVREFEVDMEWNEYKPWVTNELGSDWRSGPADAADRLTFGKNAPGDAYLISVERSGSGPLRVRIVATAMAD